MAAPQKVIECPGCGHKMVIPRGYENTPGKCRVCGLPVNTDGGGVPDPVLADEAALLRSTPKAAARKALEPEPLRRVMLKSFGTGVGAAVAGGIVTLIVMALRHQAGATPTIRSFIASSDTGLVGGFVLGFCFMLIKKRSIGPWLGMVIGCGVSATTGILCYFLEWALVAPPDQRLVEAAVVTVLGGAIAGFVLGAKVGSPGD